MTLAQPQAEPGALRSAEADLRATLVEWPDDLGARSALGALLIERGEVGAAVAELGEALRIDHRHVASLLAFSRAQAKWGNLVHAQQAARMAFDQNASPEAAAQLGAVLIARDDAGAALELAEAAIAQAPNEPHLLLLLANALKVLGRLDEARRTLRHLIALHPDETRPLISLAEIEERDHIPRLIAHLRGALAASTTESCTAGLHYALGRLLDQAGLFDDAFTHFADGARLMKRRVTYDEAYTLGICDRINGVFTKELFRDRDADLDSPSPRPIFIVGVPRSGSTLIEQILSRHPRVHCAGEIMSFADALAEERRFDPGLPLYPELVAELDGEGLCRVGNRYRDMMAAKASGAALHVNKLLGNHLFMGAIRLALPDALFVVARRHPLDACFSIFSHNFDQNVPYSFDLGELGRYYRAYEGVMAHWSTILPAACVHEVGYEALVADLESGARSLLAFLDLEWDPACLEFHRSDRPVMTASLNQVRQPLYSSSVGRWRHYERHLGPVIEAIGHD